MEPIFSLTQNLTQKSPLEIVGLDDTLFVKNFQSNLTVFLITILVSLISTPFLMIAIALLTITSEKIKKGSDTGGNTVNGSDIKNVPFTSFVRIFVEKRTGNCKVLFIINIKLQLKWNF